MTLDTLAQVSEARLYLRWAARSLSPLELLAIEMWLAGTDEYEAARAMRRSRATFWAARQRALPKMRRVLRRMGLTATHQVIGGRE